MAKTKETPVEERPEEKKSAVSDPSDPKASATAAKRRDYRRVSVKIEDDEPQENEYYLGLSRKFKLARYITLLLLIVFGLVMITFYSDDITVENFRYLMKYFGENSPVSDAQAGTVYYNASSPLSLGAFKGDLIEADPSGLHIYSAGGEMILNDTTPYDNPTLDTAGRYLMLYDLGGYSYSLFNSFSLLKSEEYLYPISNAVMSESGVYAVVTKAAGYKSAVYVYDKNFRRVGQIFKDMYVMDVAVSPSGEQLVIAYSSTTEKGSFVTEVVTYSLYSESTEPVASVNDAMALSVGYDSSSGFRVICDSRVMFFDRNGKELLTYEFGARTPVTCRIEGDYTVVIFGENIIGFDYRVIVFEGAQLRYHDTVSGHSQIVKCACDTGRLHLLWEKELTTLRLADGEITVTPVSGAASDLLVLSEGIAAVCTQSQATLYDLGAYEEPEYTVPPKPLETQPVIKLPKETEAVTAEPDADTDESSDETDVEEETEEGMTEDGQTENGQTEETDPGIEEEPTDPTADTAAQDAAEPMEEEA